jgi:hypothetical protein
MIQEKRQRAAPIVATAAVTLLVAASAMGVANGADQTTPKSITCKQMYASAVQDFQQNCPFPDLKLGGDCNALCTGSSAFKSQNECTNRCFECLETLGTIEHYKNCK